MNYVYCIKLFKAGGGNVMCVRLYQESVCKEYRTRLQSSATGFLMPDQRHFLSHYLNSLVYSHWMYQFYDGFDLIVTHFVDFGW